MRKKISNQVITILCGIIILQSIIPTSAKAANVTTDNTRVVQEVRNLIPTAIQEIDNTVLTLSKGWSGMTSAERDQLSQIFDPGNTGQIDEKYVDTILNNYSKIRRKLNDDLTIENGEDNKMCVGQRLYYTDFVKIYVCPYYFSEHREERKIRTLIQETAHMALLVVDRPYYDPKSYSSQYNALIPQGSWVTQIPVFGHLIREIVHNDTLYHPDTYAWLATEVSAMK
ncbi:MAG: M35 family metallopeptidase [Anaerolineales bacterium]|nr:M35 family metallopeptidase [Anaerolineales bacterium]